MKGGAPRVVWMTLGTDPQLISAYSAAQRLNQIGRPCHVVWNPVTGETVQLIPIVRAGLALGVAGDIDHEGVTGAREDTYGTGPLAAKPNDGAADVHTEGRLCVQVGVVGFGWQPFTAGLVTGVEAILDWFDSWQISRCWPAGRPAPFSYAHTTVRSRKLWASGGHFGASQVPCCMAAGPGAIDVDRLTGVHAPRTSGLPAPLEDEQRRVRHATLSRMADVHAEDAEAADALARAG